MPAPVTPDRKSYHHGNLRQALVEATADLVQEQGPQAFTLPEAARRAGHSPTTPRGVSHFSATIVSSIACASA